MRRILPIGLVLFSVLLSYPIVSAVPIQTVVSTDQLTLYRKDPQTWAVLSGSQYPVAYLTWQVSIKSRQCDIMFQGECRVYQKPIQTMWWTQPNIIRNPVWTVTYPQSFTYTLTVSRLQPNTNYLLIYYTDPWPGDNGIMIASFHTNSVGAASRSSTATTGSMPYPADANYGTGAKLWIVLASDYDVANHKMIAWNPSSYLFETRFIQYVQH